MTFLPSFGVGGDQRAPSAPPRARPAPSSAAWSSRRASSRSSPLASASSSRAASRSASRDAVAAEGSRPAGSGPCAASTHCGRRSWSLTAPPDRRAAPRRRRTRPPGPPGAPARRQATWRQPPAARARPRPAHEEGGQPAGDGVVIAFGHGEDEPGSTLRAPGGHPTANGTRSRSMPAEHTTTTGRPAGVDADGDAGHRPTFRRGTGGRRQRQPCQADQLGSATSAVAQRPLACEAVERVGGEPGRRWAATGRTTPARAPRPMVIAVQEPGTPHGRADRCRPPGSRPRRGSTDDPADLQAGHLPDSTPCSSTGSAPAASITSRPARPRPAQSAGGTGRRRWRRRPRSTRPSTCQTVGAGANAAACRASTPAPPSATTWSGAPLCRSAQASGPPRPRPGRPPAAPRPRRRRAARRRRRSGLTGRVRRRRHGRRGRGRAPCSFSAAQRGVASCGSGSCRASTSSCPCARRTGAGTAPPGRRSRRASACR